MATQYRPRVSDPGFFTHERVEAITMKVRDRIALCAPEQLDQIKNQDVLNMMHRVWRPHASYAYMEEMTVKIMVHTLLLEHQQWISNQHALVYNSIPRVDYDPQSVIKATYKYTTSPLGARPDVSFEY